MGVELTPEIAACLYTGVATDTGCFRFTNTTANTHLAAAKLIEAGADVEKLNERLFECRSHARIQAEKWRWKIWNSTTRTAAPSSA